MNPSLDDTLRQVAEDTLSSLAFMFPLDDGEAPSVQGSDLRWVKVEFSGPFKGCLTLAVQTDMVPQLAANMLGLDVEPPTSVQQDDALKELANVICGNLLPMVGTPADVFNVSEPRLLATKPAEGDWGDLAKVASTNLKLDSGSAMLTLAIDGRSTIENRQSKITALGGVT